MRDLGELIGVCREISAKARLYKDILARDSSRLNEMESRIASLEQDLLNTIEKSKEMLNGFNKLPGMENSKRINSDDSPKD